MSQISVIAPLNLVFGSVGDVNDAVWHPGCDHASFFECEASWSI